MALFLLLWFTPLFSVILLFLLVYVLLVWLNTTIFVSYACMYVNSVNFPRISNGIERMRMRLTPNYNLIELFT